MCQALLEVQGIRQALIFAKVLKRRHAHIETQLELSGGSQGAVLHRAPYML